MKLGAKQQHISNSISPLPNSNAHKNKSHSPCKIRSILEFASPVFHSGLTKEQSTKTELVKKITLAVIFGKDYVSYESAMSKLNLERLDTRRTLICLRFAQKCTESTRQSLMFPKNTRLRTNMRHPKLFQEHSCSTSRYHHSSIPYMARLLKKIC